MSIGLLGTSFSENDRTEFIIFVQENASSAKMATIYPGGWVNSLRPSDAYMRQ